MNRGQRRRMRKLKKYAHQDQEERELRMEALGNPLKIQKKEQAKEEDATEGEEKDAGDSALHEARTISIMTKVERKRAARKAQEKRSQETVAEAPGGEDHLEVLTGRPIDDDVFRFCLPVCAPYSVLSKYKFKVKLTPGSSKRGKASKEAIEIFLRGYGTSLSKGKVTEREKAFIRLITDNERVQSMVSKVKVSRPSDAKSNGKGGKKGGKKKGGKGGGKRAAAGRNKGNKKKR